MGSSYLKLTKTSEKFNDGCYKCHLRMFDEKEQLVASWMVCTGQGWAQDFRIAGNNIPGSMEPLPQGDYVVHDPDWAGGKDNWGAGVSLGAGIGPVFIPVICLAEKRRGEFGIHMDYNRATSPGTAGCIGVLDEADMKEIVKYLRLYDPKIMHVDWGL